ncbi:MAG: hypothetical protein IJ515_05285 [Clostridia bacterium]|nr:hypothetical protein [Clostridia bacterium]
MKCINCGGENVISGSFTSFYGVSFCEAGTENKLRPNTYKILCKACCDCGKMFDFEIKLKPKKNNKKTAD